MPPFATGFGCSANLMAGKSYFGAFTVNCYSSAALVPKVEMEEEVVAADATQCLEAINATSCELAVTPSIRCAINANAINVVTFN